MKFLKKEIPEAEVCEKECRCPMKIFDSEIMRVLAVGMLAILACSAITALAMHTVKRLTGGEGYTCD